MDLPLRILHLEDDPTDSALVRETLEADGVSCEIIRIDTRAAFSTLLDQGGFDLILADVTLPAFDGFSALKLATATRPDVPFIFVSGTLDEEIAIESLKFGATDYVFKTKMSRIVPSVRRALREADERVRRAEAEKALRRSESYLVEAQRISHTGSFGVELSSGQIRWSEETFRIFGFEPGTMPTVAQILDRTYPDDRKIVEQVIHFAAHEGKQFDVEHRLLMPGGSIKYVRVVGRPLENQREFVGAVMDMTDSRRADADRKDAQEALRIAQTELAHIARVMTAGELAASLAHEIKQPMAAAVLSANTCVRWLNGAVPDIAEAREAATRMVADTRRASDIIDRVRSLYTRAAPRCEPIPVDELIGEMVTLLRNEASWRSVTIHTALDAAPRMIVADRVQLQQVLMNLMLNGIDAMTPTGGELHITARTTVDEELLITVRDAGVGIPAEHADRIFDAFFTTKPHGIGMGLSISRTIVEWHGGRLWATANAERGTSFQFTLPSAIKSSLQRTQGGESQALRGAHR